MDSHRAGGVAVTPRVWTTEIDEDLETRWATGASASKIADAMSQHFQADFTKGMVLGRARRIGLVGRPAAVTRTYASGTWSFRGVGGSNARPPREPGPGRPWTKGPAKKTPQAAIEREDRAECRRLCHAGMPIMWLAEYYGWTETKVRKVVAQQAVSSKSAAQVATPLAVVTDAIHTETI